MRQVPSSDDLPIGNKNPKEGSHRFMKQVTINPVILCKKLEQTQKNNNNPVTLRDTKIDKNDFC